MLVSASVHPLVGRDPKSCNLVKLTHDEHGHPHEVEDTVEEHPEHPGRAGGDLRQVLPETVFGVRSAAVHPPVGDAAIHHPADHTEQEKEVTHEVTVIPTSNTVADPGTVMIELCDAAVTNRTVFGPDGLPYQASAAKYA